MTDSDCLKLLDKALVICAATHAEKESARRQLKFSLTFGRIGKEEMRSLGYSCPLVGHIFAEELGGDLRDLMRFAEEGQITSAVMRRAFANAEGVIENQFSLAVDPFGKALSDFGNAAVDCFAGFIETIERIATGMRKKQ